MWDLKNYKFPEGKRKITPQIYRTLPSASELAVGNKFDINNYRFIFNDKKTRELIRRGDTIGCFYIESPGMRSLLKRLDCDNFEMLTAASSIIRPGVAESGMMKEFVERHKDPSKRKYLVPGMEDILGETYGVMVYQEDVIKVAHHIAGLSLEEADLLRRAMSGKMRSKQAMERLQTRFFDSCREKGLSDKNSRILWHQISSFAGYAFCKAHSASFAVLSFQVAYLKVHYPAEFMSSVLSNNGGYYSPAVYIQECKRMGLEVHLPCVNQSDYEYIGEKKTVRIGLIAIKNLSVSSAKKIVKERKSEGFFASLLNFLSRTNLGYEESAILIKCGAMDTFQLTRPSLMRLLDIYLHRKKLISNENFHLFAEESLLLEKDVLTDKEYSMEEICSYEYETLGFMISKHPLNFWQNILSRPEIIKASDIYKFDKMRIKVLGWYMTSKRIKTKKGEIMKFLSLEDTTGTFEAVLFPKVYSVYAEKTMSMGPYYIEGIVDMETGNNIVVEKLAVLSAKQALAATQKDSSENKYFGDTEKFHEEEIELAENLGKENLRQAYL